MTQRSINPATGEQMEAFEPLGRGEMEDALEKGAAAASRWAAEPFTERGGLLAKMAGHLREHSQELARLMSREMGKLLGEAEGEVEKCAWVCDHYAEHGQAYLEDETIVSDASRSLVAYEPLGTVLAIMPWNFPLWQLFRCAAPALAAGNTVLLKHASNVPQCALAIEGLFDDVGAPAGVFQTLLIGSDQAGDVIADPRVHGVSLTGSDAAGRKVAALAGSHLKKLVLELGGSDAFVVLEDADVAAAAQVAVQSRFQNCGQSCIAAKRFIVVEAVAEEFIARFMEGATALEAGDPLDTGTTLAPMAREDLRDDLHKQVTDSVAAGAAVLTGGAAISNRPGWYYAPTVLDNVGPGMPAYHDELFGPVASIIRARDEADALAIANDSRFGLGGSVWTADTTRGERFARRMACGSTFVNGLVKSDPRLPFGGIKDSGYGRELSRLGIREFVNAKTLWVA
ncbi:MAG: NAD-dependent succinate-semialdehyde dehydrogenase [Gammaproteobacteria bacterium]|nr:NAD-dependent succinate-semialdehyde dehydrogenase [Gammaproteobacteria bacterium]